MTAAGERLAGGGTRAPGDAAPGTRPHRSWSVWARTLAGVALLASVVWCSPAGALTGAAAAVDAPAVLAALGIGAVTTVLSAARWRAVALGVGLRLPWGRAVAAYYLALFLNAVLPAGVLGDAHRAVDHGRSCGDPGRGVRAVVLERVVGQVVLAVTGAALLFALPAALLGPGLRAAGTAAGAVAAIGLGCALALRAGRARRPRWWRALAGFRSEVRAGLVARAPLLLALSAAALTGHVALFLVAARAAGVGAPVLQLVPLLVLSLLAMSVPVGVGGWGPREAVTALAFGAAGLGAQAGLTVSVVYGLLVLVAALPGGAVLLVRWWSVFLAVSRPSGNWAVGHPERGRWGSPRAARYPAKESTSAASRARPLAAVAREGRPTTPEEV
ncbi:MULTISPECIES: lysylphosphatidylglycerol synthase domain-containing protein [unclassified Nocardiopsis]|uniref:lysylphosphatidylglycerol synthase domain-containing protein n=1 Tax=unclassified Nocardiopsis TaxID=2649073 RepID=UPI001F264B13|nr:MULTISPECIES: lysylphosphatidylglycerol synthase domain-containing protein [unclassified Nocardiopsis]